jgi:hypothetical protein
MITKLQKKNIFLSLILVLSFSLIGLGVFGIAHAQTQTIVPITPSGGATFQNTGWNARVFEINTQSIANSQYIYIEVSGTSTNDPYQRYLFIEVNGIIINKQPLPSGDAFQVPIYGGPSQSVGYYTDIVQNSFSVRYDVTSALHGSDYGLIDIGLTTQTGAWNVQAELIGIGTQQPTVPIPTGGSSSTPSNTILIPLSEILGGLGILSLIGAVWLKEKSE